MPDTNGVTWLLSGLAFAIGGIMLAVGGWKMVYDPNVTARGAAVGIGMLVAGAIVFIVGVALVPAGWWL